MNCFLNLLLVLLSIPTLSGCSSKADGSRIEFLAFSPGKKWLVAAGGTWLKTSQMKIWKCSDWKPHSDWTKESVGQFQYGRFFSENEVGLLRGNPKKGDLKYGDNELFIWKIHEGSATVIDLKNARGFANQIDLGPKANMLVFNQWSRFGTAGVYALPALDKRAEFGNGYAFNAIMRSSPDGKMVLCCNRTEISLFDVASGKVVKGRKLDHGDAESYVRSAAFSPKGDMIVIGLVNPNRIYVFPSDLGATSVTLQTNQMPTLVSFTPDNEMIAFLNDKRVELYSVKQQMVIKMFDEPKGAVESWCFSEDGAMIAVSNSWRVRVIDTKTGKLLANLD